MDEAPAMKINSVPAAILGDLLREYTARMPLSSASRVLVSHAKLSAELQHCYPAPDSPEIALTSAVIAPHHVSDAPGINGGILQRSRARSDHGAAVPPDLPILKEKSYSHAFIHLTSETDAEAARLFKWVVWSLRPKGILVVLVPVRDAVVSLLRAALTAHVASGTKASEPSPVVDGDRLESRHFAVEGALPTMLEQAGLERGKIRVLGVRTHRVPQGAEADAAVTHVRRELEAALGTSDGTTAEASPLAVAWIKPFEHAAWSEVMAHNGLLSEAHVVLAIKWDELSA